MNVFRMNAVVSEQSTGDAGDESAQLRACLENTVRKLQKEVACDNVMSECERPLTVSAEDNASGTDNVIVERIGVRTGNAMIDQYEPYYWGCAFAFLFVRITVGILTCQRSLIRSDSDVLQMLPV